MSRRILLIASKRTSQVLTRQSSMAFGATRGFSTIEELPDSIRRVGLGVPFPNEFPGNDYSFNWTLNRDGVTPLKELAFQISKPLDLRIAGLEPLATKPNIKPAPAKKMPEAGSDDLTFELFDEYSVKAKDGLTYSTNIYAPEGDVPGTRTPVRVITNSTTLPSQVIAYLDRTPRRYDNKPITVYAFETAEEEDFAGYAIEEVEEKKDDESVLEKSMASIVVVGKKLDMKVIATGLNFCHEGLEADAAERAAAEAEGADQA